MSLTNGGDPTSFCVVGIITLPEFQKVKCYVEKLHKYYPQKFLRPDVRAMLDVSWKSFLLTMQRKYGGNLWRVNQPVVVFKNGVFLNYQKFIDYVNRSYKIYLNEDFYELGEVALVNELKLVTGNGRKFVYLSIMIGTIHVGSMLFMLYCDLVPRTCQFFIDRCLSPNYGWVGTEVIKIQKHSFIQCGSTTLKPVDIPCENYAIPHDRRGVISTCNFGKHEENSVQFTISLAETPWMDYKYVAFGQLIHGEEVLSAIEHLESFYCKPTEQVVINCAGLYLLPCEDETESVEITKKTSKASLNSRTSESAISLEKYFKGLYCLKTDLKSHLPFYHLPKYLLKYLIEHKEGVVEEEHFCPDEAEEEEESRHKSFSTLKLKESVQFRKFNHSYST